MSTLALFDREKTEVVDSSDAQCTPRDLALELGWFDLDPCSNPRSHILARETYSLENGQDGLALPWIGSVWCNGRYSEPLPWCQRLRRHDGPWCALWKLDTTTRWFAELLSPGPRGTVATWAPFRSRLRFDRPGNVAHADFASVLVWRDWTPPDAVKARLWMPMERGS
jgi:hypothetical protein